MTPELMALIIFALDKGFEYWEKKDMTPDQIKADIIKQIEIYQAIKAQIDAEIEKYGGNQ